MRILICTNSFPPRFVGGAELVAHQVGKQMAGLGHNVAVLAGDLNWEIGRHALSQEIYDGVPVYRIAMRPEDYDPATRNDLIGTHDEPFRKVIREFRPDVIHCHNLAGLSVRIPLLAAEANARVFLTLHDFWGFCLRNTLLRPTGETCSDRTACASCLGGGPAAAMTARLRNNMIALAFSRVERFIAPSRYLADAYVATGLPTARMTVVPNGIDTEPFAATLPQPAFVGRGEGVVNFLYVGYLGPHKGVDVLLRALSVMSHRAKVRLDLVGEGPSSTALREQVRQLGLDETVRFRGRVQPSSMAGVFRACDVLVLPSVWTENQPVCIMEAMACGRPVIASRAGGIPEMIDEGREGLLVKPGDEMALAKALDVMAASADLRQAMGDAARRRVHGYSYRDQAVMLEGLFGEPDGSPKNPVPDRPLTALLGDIELPVSGGADFPLNQDAGYALPLGWLPQHLRAAVSSYAPWPCTDWRLKLMRVLAGQFFDMAALPWWRRWIVRALMHNEAANLLPTPVPD